MTWRLLISAFILTLLGCAPTPTSTPLSSPTPVSSPTTSPTLTATSRPQIKQNDLVFIEFFAIT